jgi:long-subunit acyl-CoA synthetase (AMP-forming)
MSIHGPGYRFGSVGKNVPGVETRISDPNSKGEGEILMWGRNVMMGYLNREDKTNEDLTVDGWMKSGDQGIMDEDGFLYITGITLHVYQYRSIV